MGERGREEDMWERDAQEKDKQKQLHLMVRKKDEE